MNTAREHQSTTNWTKLKEDIIAIAPSLGIDQIGFAAADPFLALKDILIRHRELGRESGFEEPDIDKRVYPGLSMEAPQSIIAIAVAYPSKLGGSAEIGGWGLSWYDLALSLGRRLSSCAEGSLSEATGLYSRVEFLMCEPRSWWIQGRCLTVQ